MTREDRQTHRKALAGYGRAELLRLLLAALDQLDATDDVCGSDAILETLAPPTELAERVESSLGSTFREPVAHTLTGERR